MTNPRHSLWCIECGGKCCQRMAGCALPDDIHGGPSMAAFKSMAASGRWSVDWWNGDVVDGGDLDRCYYWRPRTVTATKLFDPSWGGQCSWLTPDGCDTKWDGRPAGCRLLVAAADGNCTQMPPFDDNVNDKLVAARAWRPWHHLFVELSEAQE